MGFGATITLGENNTPLSADLAQWLVEARVEQELSKPTKFAIRFEDDICNGNWVVSAADEIRPNNMVSVLAPSGENTICLVRGRITKIKSASQIGGTGSWVEIHGEDRRVEMDRVTVQANWKGPASEIIKSVLSGYEFSPEVETLEQEYDDEQQLNQRGTDLAFLNKIASENGLDFWIINELNEEAPFNDDVDLTEYAHIERSPPEAGAFNLGELSLPDAETPPSLIINVQGDLCPNVNAFNVEVDTERPNQATGSTVEIKGVETRFADTETRPAPVGEGTDIASIDGVERTINTPEPGDTAEQRRRQEATLRDAAWFVEGSVSSSVNQLGAVLMPHQIIKTTGAGNRLSIPFQIKSVIHVITASDHMMDIKMRSNILGKDK